MITEVFKCKDCGAIMVIDVKDIWRLVKCPRCESKNIQNVDDVFDFTEVIGEDEDVK